MPAGLWQLLAFSTSYKGFSRDTVELKRSYAFVACASVFVPQALGCVCAEAS
jgi:hypothetical protein